MQNIIITDDLKEIPEELLSGDSPCLLFFDKKMHAKEGFFHLGTFTEEVTVFTCTSPLVPTVKIHITPPEKTESSRDFSKGVQISRGRMIEFSIRPRCEKEELPKL